MNILVDTPNINKKKYSELTLLEMAYILKFYKNCITRNIVNKISLTERRKHFDFLLQKYQGVVIEEINKLAYFFNIDYRTNMIAFDTCFKYGRKNNINHISFMEILVPIEEQRTSKQVDCQILVGEVIYKMIQKIYQNPNIYNKIICIVLKELKE